MVKYMQISTDKIRKYMKIGREQAQISMQKSMTFHVYIITVLLVVLIGLVSYLIFNQKLPIKDVNNLQSTSQENFKKTSMDEQTFTPTPSITANGNVLEISQDQLITTPSVFKSYSDEDGFECSGRECLIGDTPNDNIYGFTTITGYYQQEEWESFGGEETCDTFVITSMSQRLYDYADYRLNKVGNTFYFKHNARNQLVTMLLMNELNENQKLLLNQSSVEQPVTLGVVFKTFPTGGFSMCTSPFDVIYLKK